GTVIWMFNTGGTSVWALEQLSDVNGDGYLEVIAGDFGGNVYIIDPNGWGIIESASVGSNIIIRFAKLDDVNNDGHPDILLAYSGTNGVVLSGYDLSTVWFTSLADKAWVADRIGDVTGDAINDAIIGTLFTNNYCYFMDGVNGEELLSVAYYTPLDAIRAIPDIVGDLSMEMVAGGRNGRVYCYSGGLDAATAIPETPDQRNGIKAYCYPNPIIAGNSTSIHYAIDKDGYTEVGILNMQGRLVRNLYNGNSIKGINELSWDGRDVNGNIVPAGIYLCRIRSGGASMALKISVN
ncbi:MAG TPA: T9SS type A sorting domain-containing protein, partial [Bacteroidales bacterium]|nr:T9SS type A sorting domain-containing protein [Bacteroidales bacterium]